MTGPSSWRSLQTVMLVTLHVATVASMLRTFSRPTTLIGSVFWVLPTIALATFLSWPIGRAIASVFDPAEPTFDRICPRCGRRDIRPLVKAGAGIFQPVTGYRCVSCWNTFRAEAEGERLSSTFMPEGGPEIVYLSDPIDDDSIRFLDESPKSPSES